MKYKVTMNDSVELLIVADSEQEAVKKAREIKESIRGNKKDADIDGACEGEVQDESTSEKVRKAQEWVDYDIKHYGEVSANTKKIIEEEGLSFDKWSNQVHDADKVVDFAEFSRELNKKPIFNWVDVVDDGKWMMGGVVNLGISWKAVGVVGQAQAEMFMKDLKTALAFCRNFKYNGYKIK